MSPAAKLRGFLLLLAVVFAGAYAAGAHLGPVTVGSSAGTSSPGPAPPAGPASPGAWPLHRAAWAGLGHGAATMDTLVSMAVAASFGW